MASFRFELELDAAKYKRGSEEAANATEDLADELASLERSGTRDIEDLAAKWDGVGDGAENAARKVEDELEAATDAATASAETLEDRWRAALDALPGASRRAGEDSAKGLRDGLESDRITSDDLVRAEMLGEVVSNFNEAGAEVARGFKDGFSSEDAETILDGITDTLVAVGAAGGPLGGVAGVAGAAVMQAFAGPFIAEAQASAELFEETYSGAFANVLEAGEAFGREMTISDTTTAIAEDVDKMNRVMEVANELGLDHGVILRAMAGDQDAYNLVLEKQQGLVDPLVDSITELGNAARDQGGMSQEQAAGLNTLRESLEDVQALTDDVTRDYETNTEALNAGTAAARAKADADAWASTKALENAQAIAESTGQASQFVATIDGATVALAAMPDGKVVEVTDDGTITDVQVDIDRIRGRDVSIRTQATNTDWTNTVLNSVATQRNVPFYMQPDYWQAQNAADRTAASIRPPTVYVNMTYGMRAV